MTTEITTKTTTTGTQSTTLMSTPQPTTLITATMSVQTPTTRAQASTSQTLSTTAPNATRITTAAQPTTITTQSKAAVIVRELTTSIRKTTQPLPTKTAIIAKNISNSTTTQLKPTTHLYSTSKKTTNAAVLTTSSTASLQVTASSTNETDFSIVGLQTTGYNYTDIKPLFTSGDSLNVSGTLRSSLVITSPTGITNLMDISPSGDLGVEESGASVCNSIPCDSKVTPHSSYDKGLICCRRRGVFNCCPGWSSAASPRHDDLDVSEKVESNNLKPEVKLKLSKTHSSGKWCFVIIWWF